MKENNTELKVPTFDTLINPLFKALKDLGGSGTVEEIYKKVIESENISDEVLSVMQSSDGRRTKVDYNLAWARTYLKNYGAIINTERGVWMIASEYYSAKEIDEKAVVSKVRKMGVKKKVLSDNLENLFSGNNIKEYNVELPEELMPWRDELKLILLNMDPFAFERLSKVLLRECGITQIEVTKKTNDGGIDGYGKLKINGLISFNIAFQCKRYRGQVSAAEIRDFRGSMTADIEKGIFITTGIYSRSAVEEAEKIGKKQIDLVDGEQFMDMLVKFKLGVKEEVNYIIEKSFFENS